MDVRLAVVEAFLPPAAQPKSRSSKGQSVSGMIRPGAATLPGGPAGAAIDRLLGAALDDRGQRIGLSAKFDDLSVPGPSRVRHGGVRLRDTLAGQISVHLARDTRRA